MFAGPNGSGKSTLKSYLPENLLGIYLNPDEIEQEIRTTGYLQLSAHGVASSAEEILPFFTGSRFLATEGRSEAAKALTFGGGRLGFEKVEVDSYLASVAVAFLQQKLLSEKRDFTFETVMSHPGKVELMKQARSKGYRTYLYFVATDDPAINISRVQARVNMGGHPVPEDKIVKRYHLSLGLLMEAIRYSNRAYIFDNSGDNADQKHTWLAEITDGRRLELKTDKIPAWFKTTVLDQATTEP